ncbi:MAG: response regulator, partial [Acidobacteriota bacterium]|nr:response regulator [Acidobacteriota bacterium]
PLEIDLLFRPIQWDGSPALIIVAADASVRIRLEDQFRQAQKMESLGMLAGGIAHDFNNLLTIISGYSQMLLSSLSENTADRSTVEQILRASQRAADLTSQLLSFSRRHVVQPKTIDLNSTVVGMSTMLRRIIGENIDLAIETGCEFGFVHADPGQIDQVIMNLVVNARDAMPTGGRLLIETRGVELDERYAEKLLTARPGDYVMLAVTDTGNGMDEKTRRQIFDPFFTTKEEGQGTGLGLSTVYGIVKQSSGAIDVYSELGFGTSVKVYFPRVDRMAAPEAAKETHEAAGGLETVLVAEDDEAVRHLVRKALEKGGYSLLVAASGAEALRLVKEHRGPIHLLITDVVMPRMSGTELARRLHRLRPDMAVLYMSGYTDSALRRGGNTDAAVQFLPKPFSPAALKRKVRETLDAMRDKAVRSDGAGGV